MKILDGLLLSSAIGLSVLTAWLFTSDYPPPVRPGVQIIVLHHADCPDLSGPETAEIFDVAIGEETSAQVLLDVLASLCREYGLTPVHIQSHGVDCPGAGFGMDSLRTAVRRRLDPR